MNNQFELAYLEANALHRNAIIINSNIKETLEKNPYVDTEIFGDIVAANILISLSIELYIKTFMLRNRIDGVIKGHSLVKLYNELPQVYKNDIISNYTSIFTGEEKMVELAFIFSKNKPERPDTYSNVKFNNFEESLSAVSDIFVRSRYFFEEINVSEWSILSYYFEAGDAIAKSLDITFNNILKGDILPTCLKT